MSKPGHIFRTLSKMAIGSFLLVACENDINEVRALTKSVVAMEQGKDIVTYYSQTGKMRAKLTSPIMNRYDIDTPYIEFPKTLHVDFFNDSLKIETKLDAKYGKYRENENKVFLRDSVIIINMSGDTVFCKELWWDQRKEKFYTDKYVELRRKSDTLRGLNGMEAAQDLSSRTFFNAKGITMVANDSMP
ncbi:LPS export ABC transporter periplasmic protein LptC [Pinibacter aurantiacus]|uniref:LPS export ABC transporter periplasmic protein LptC n=1 Tax=Pinibacter aurantiacus TaxID=2851599 RepID=A0A9E2W333_9BACT|nr:LPS export ABC transporter periplasmic protein LptC [Pinibacter aurantiacus]MBV4356404.1 LPS export ABC transporter periplasmic protein LptC [Pinibacter aurantiacus]